MGVYALLAGAAVGVVGLLALRRLAGRSIAVHVCVLLVGIVVAGTGCRFVVRLPARHRAGSAT